MDIETIWLYAPKAFVTLVGLGLVFEMRKYKRKNDPAAWLRDIHARAAKAAGNERFRQDELADADAEIGKCPVPDPVVPVTNRQQVRIAGFPKMMFMSGLTGVVFIYLGLFETMPSGTAWPVFAGWGFLVLTLLLYWLAERARPVFRRVQQLNRKYLLQKAGGDAGRLETLREVIKYYPNLSELWLELGDQCAAEGRFDEAVEAIGKARAIAPEKIDLAFVEVSFQIRRNDMEAAGKALAQAETMRRAASDPRAAVYRAALALRKNEKKAALRHGKEALELDAAFSGELVKKDAGLADVAAMLEPLLREKEAELFDAVAARQEARKAAEAEKSAETAKDEGKTA